MPPIRFDSSSIKNKIKREEVFRKSKKAKNQLKLQKRLEQAKLEASDPVAKKKRLTENVPRTLDNMREHDPSMLAPEQSSAQAANESTADMAADPFQSYFTSVEDPMLPPKVLITTSAQACKSTYEFCDELVGLFPGAEFIRRKKGKGFELGRIAGWAANRGYKHLCVVNEDRKKANAITLVHLPHGPTAYFKLTSVQLTHELYGHARATPHNPELVLNGFATRLGHTVGRMFQILFPPMPEFQGRQVVTLHNQRDFLFFRRHRYAFRSPEKVALQEIGPRFTLKLKYMKKGLPAVQNFGEAPQSLVVDVDENQVDEGPDTMLDSDSKATDAPKSADQGGIGSVGPAGQDEYIWIWKPELETSRRTFFL